MSRAVLVKGYLSETGNYIECEAVSPATRRGKIGCARFGSKETNPNGYVLAWIGVISFGALLWISSRSGRGLKVSREY